MLRLLPLILLAACDPYADWPAAEDAFPWVYTPEAGLEDYELVRWETETWNPADDLASAGRYLLKLQNKRQGAPIESLEHFESMRTQIPPLGTGRTLSFVGDVMWVGENWSHFADPVAPLIDGDLRIGNLETPTSPDHSTDLDDLGLFTFNSPPEILDGLPLDVLQLNNNHTMDVDEDGLENTLAEVAARGFVQTGIDTHATVAVGGQDVAFLSYTWGLNMRPEPADHEVFVIPFGHDHEEIDLSRIAEDVSANPADTHVVLVHWGFEFEYYADPHFLQLGRRIVQAGADLVVGHGPHVVQPPELCHVNQPDFVPGVGTCSLRTDDDAPRDALILYSLGDFSTTAPTLPIETGIIATVSLDPLGVGWEAVTNVSLAGRRTVVPLVEHAVDSLDHASELARLDAHLGTGWKRPPRQGTP